MLRRSSRLAIAAAGVALAVLALLYLLRLELTSRWLVRELVALGVPQPELRVTRLGARGVSLRAWWASSSAGAVLPALEVADARIVLDAEGGATELDLKLVLAPGADGSASGELRANARNVLWEDFALESAELELPFRISSSAD